MSFLVKQKHGLPFRDSGKRWQCGFERFERFERLGRLLINNFQVMSLEIFFD